MKRSKHDPRQLDLFGYQESIEDRIHYLKCKEEKTRRSFHARYTIVIKELDEIRAELEELTHARKIKAIA